MSGELLQQVRVLDPVSGSDRVADVSIADGLIQAVQDRISDWPSDTQVRDCRGLVLGPGLVDLYSHSGEPGFEEREALDSLVQAAMAGGFTRVALLPETTPPVDNLGGLALLQSKIQPSQSKLQFWAALTVGVAGQQMTELGELAGSAIAGFTDGLPLSNLGLVRRLLEYLQPFGKPIALWPCDLKLVANGVMREGTQSVRLGLPGNPAISETAALAALLESIEAIGTPVHLMRISCARSVELIRTAKQRGVPITASTTWMHLLLDTEAIGGRGGNGQSEEETVSLPNAQLPTILPYDPNLRLDPPLGNPGDRVALIQGVREGTIDAIAIDHSPYTYEEKTVAFGDAPPGAIGLELALPILWQELVASNRWSALDLWRVLSTQPARCLGQTPGTIAPGMPAEVILFDPQQTWTVEKQTLRSRATNTPWLGQSLRGRVVQTWI